MDVLQRIKRLAFRGQLGFSLKSREEMRSCGLNIDDIVESIITAQTIAKTLRSRSSMRRYAGEKLYVIKSFNFSGTAIYTKGAIVREPNDEDRYYLVSSKTVAFGE